MKILVLGVNGLIGSTVFRYLSETTKWQITGTVRNPENKKYFKDNLSKNIFSEIDLQDETSIIRLMGNVKPDVVMNCAGITKHISGANDVLKVIPVNSLFPHKMNEICKIREARFIHISTDCVFSGSRGNYTEDDIPDAGDLYGRSKILGEVTSDNALTVRISTIGHELNSAHGLLNWFLNQQNECKGFVKAVFSGFPTVYFAEILKEYIIPNNDLKGLYHISSNPVSKFDLLNLISKIYKKDINIVPDESLNIDRSLNSDKFKKNTGFISPDWDELIEKMYKYYKNKESL